MTINLITRKENKLQLKGDLLTGDTFAVKEFIKAYCGGKWNKDAKGWNIDLNKLNTLVEGSNHIGLRIDDSPVAIHKSAQTDNGYCRKCQSWCYGDCESN